MEKRKGPSPEQNPGRDALAPFPQGNTDQLHVLEIKEQRKEKPSPKPALILTPHPMTGPAEQNHLSHTCGE